MRLATRTAIAAFIAAFVTLLLTGLVFRGRFAEILEDRVEAQLDERAETAPILAAIAERLSLSELSATVEPARVLVHGELVELGELPDEALPEPAGPGRVTATADGQRWRLSTIEVRDVPDIGDLTLVQLAEPLGDVDREISELRGRVVVAGLLVSIAAGVVGWLLGVVAARPLTLLRRDAGRLRDDPASWRMGEQYGSPEVDDVAGALNTSLGRLAEVTVRRDRALDAARAFAASASHELRTPLQSALTNLDIARSVRATAESRIPAIEHAHEQVQRMATSLAAVRALADAEFADPAWFEPIDLVEAVQRAVDDERRRAGDATIEVVDAAGDGGVAVTAWRDGVRLATANLVRNALVHARRPDGRALRIVVTVDGPVVTVDDDGPGVPEHDRERVLDRFVAGERSSGSGLGLAIAGEVAASHGGALSLDASPLGGLRAVLRLAPE
jgi:two-component system sensor histidine kinase PrrB